MFTTYIHVLEVLAMRAEGCGINTIVDMGCAIGKGKIKTALNMLEEEGFVNADRAGRIVIWTMTEKGVDYMETVTRKYWQYRPLDEIAAYVGGA